MLRTVQDLLDLESGELLKADDFLSKDKNEIFKLRRQLEIGIQKKNCNIVCAICLRPVKLRAGLERIVHFAHLKDSPDCPIKTDTKYTKREWLKIIYNGTKESIRHINMKNRINEILLFDNRFCDIKIEKTIKDIVEKSKWKKPDIQCKYENKTIVFEMQISHTFLSEIVARDIFYNINEIPLYWICDEFYPNFDYIKIFHCDILYHHNCNLIIFDNEAYKYSLKNRRLTFKIYWLQSYIQNNKVLNNWHQKLVDISEIKNDKENKLYYYDYEGNENNIKNESVRIEKLDKYNGKKERVFNVIRKLDDEYTIDNENYCIDRFTYEINSMSEFNLPQWDDKNDIFNLFFIFRIFLSIREKKYYGYKINNIIQLLNIFYSKMNMKEYYWLLIMFIENGDYDELIKKEKNCSTFYNQKIKYLNSSCNKSQKYTKYLHWFFKEIKNK